MTMLHVLPCVLKNSVKNLIKLYEQCIIQVLNKCIKLILNTICDHSWLSVQFV